MVKLFRAPKSGAIVVCNADEWTGVHGNPPGDFGLPPDWHANDPPGFVSPAPNTVGSVLTLHLGTTIPEGLVVDSEIGVGSHAETTTERGDFAGPFIETGGTIPVEWVDLQPVGRFTVFANRQTKTLYVPLGLTIEDVVDPPDPHPAALTSLDWTAEEIRDQSPSGRRRVRWLRSITVPEGFELVLRSSSSDPATQPSAVDPVVTPPTTFSTPSGLPIGSTCHNRLWWRRLSDGALGNPSNVVSFVILGLVTDPGDPPSDPTLSPDLTVSYANLRSQIQAWFSNPPSIPDSKRAYVLGYSGGNTSGTFNLSGLTNPHQRPIIVRPVGGTYRDELCTVKHSGGVTFNNSRNIWLALAHTSASAGVSTIGSTLCGLLRCLIEARTPNELLAPQNDYLMQIRECSGFTIAHCLVRHADQAPILFWSATGHRIYGSMCDYTPCDDMKVFGFFNNGLVERNWGARRHCPGKFAATSGTPHADFWQHQGHSQLNSRTWGNVDLIKPGLIHPGSAYGRSRQVFFHKWESGATTQQDFAGSTWQQNISFSQLGQVLMDVFPSRQGQSIRYNTAICAGGPANNQGAIIEALAPRDFNFVNVVGTQASADGAAGPNGIGLVIGHRDSSGVSHRYYDANADFFRYGIPWQDSDGTAVPLAQQTLKAFEPKAGTRLHWANPNPVGAYLRSREIFDTSYRAQASAAAGYPVIPHCWPVLSVWHDLYNSDGYVADDYTGSYDSNGDPA